MGLYIVVNTLTITDNIIINEDVQGISEYEQKNKPENKELVIPRILKTSYLVIELIREEYH